jgi:hypothetical protein
MVMTDETEVIVNIQNYNLHIVREANETIKHPKNTNQEDTYRQTGMSSLFWTHYIDMIPMDNLTA